ncbi:hypothetical protein B0H13DRAFT_1894153 [Mycena leptocephala]|nr:hypothetical protein B0H13DRAFT_1894153 [Mycena leptocephala]
MSSDVGAPVEVVGSNPPYVYFCIGDRWLHSGWWDNQRCRRGNAAVDTGAGVRGIVVPPGADEDLVGVDLRVAVMTKLVRVPTRRPDKKAGGAPVTLLPIPDTGATFPMMSGVVLLNCAASRSFWSEEIRIPSARRPAERDAELSVNTLASSMRAVAAKVVEMTEVT